MKIIKIAKILIISILILVITALIIGYIVMSSYCSKKNLIIGNWHVVEIENKNESILDSLYKNTLIIDEEVVFIPKLNSFDTDEAILKDLDNDKLIINSNNESILQGSFNYKFYLKNDDTIVLYMFNDTIKIYAVAVNIRNHLKISYDCMTSKLLEKNKLEKIFEYEKNQERFFDDIIKRYGIDKKPF